MVLKFARRVALLVLPWLTLGVAKAEDSFLPPKDAYKYTVEATQGNVVVRIDIQPGYYLYRDRLGLESATPGVTIGAPDFPVGEDHEDQYFGKQVIYRGPIAVAAKLGFDGPPRPFDLTLKLQGCADAGLCYPPQRWTSRVEVAAEDAAAPSAAAASGAGSTGGDANSARMAQAVAQMVQMKYGRGDELASDKWGVRLTYLAGYDPRSMIGVMEVLDKASGGAAPPEFFSTHPKPANRVEYIKRVIAEEFPNGVPDGLKK
jgi:thiol:disulfide interchange protein